MLKAQYANSELRNALKTHKCCIFMHSCEMQRHIYGQEEKNMNIFSDRRSLLAIYQHMFMWLDVLSQTHRVAPFLSNDAAIITALKKV